MSADRLSESDLVVVDIKDRHEGSKEGITKANGVHRDLYAVRICLLVKLVHVKIAILSAIVAHIYQEVLDRNGVDIVAESDTERLVVGVDFAAVRVNPVAISIVLTCSTSPLRGEWLV